ncbi:MAG TPA: hypothetical protein RMH99_28270 [Sandaracinaceae bacterium LLY-WYZ-13_1]|nr:hypothetical protein [Sandaracinaceae bacterium LLY-WYZ-13_1]
MRRGWADRDGLAERVAFLSRDASFPQGPPHEAVETHMSWVFLAGDRAYKLKKPLRTERLDHTTVEKRRTQCQREVRLNRRLAPSVYLGVTPLIRSGAGWALGPLLEPPVGHGPADVVDWLVTMRRLDPQDSLEARVEDGRATAADVDRVVARLAAFYREAEPVGWTGRAYRRRLEAEVEEHHRRLARAPGLDATGSFEPVREGQRALLARHAPTFEARAGRVVDAHGDLRPEHVFLAPDDDPVMIDCLEFDRELRLLDVASELCFLALELARLGAPGLGARVLEVWRAGGDEVLAEVSRFYRSHHACVRALLALWHLDDPDTADRERYLARARAYRTLALEDVGSVRGARAGA